MPSLSEVFKWATAARDVVEYLAERLDEQEEELSADPAGNGSPR